LQTAFSLRKPPSEGALNIQEEAMGYGTPIPLRPVAGIIAAPEAFTPVSDPMPFFGRGSATSRPSVGGPNFAGGGFPGGGGFSPGLPPGIPGFPGFPPGFPPSVPPGPPPGPGGCCGGTCPPGGDGEDDEDVACRTAGPRYDFLPRQCDAFGPVDDSYGEAANGSLIDPARGNLIEEYATPAGGPLDPVIVLTYNDVYRGNADEYPDGWTSNFNRRIDNSTFFPKVAVISGSGIAYQYTAATSPNFTSPDESVNWLKLEGSGWVETQPDGLKYYFDSSGNLAKLANHLGKVWTLTYNVGPSGSLEITNPALKVTTLQYASNKLQTIIDPGGRRTTLTVSSNQLTAITSPELCQTQFAYDGSGRLEARVSPAGNRTTFSYDGSGRVSNVTYPGGDKTTFAYSTSASIVTTVYTNQRGKVTTFVHTGTDRLLETIIDANGQITTLSWDGKRVDSIENALREVSHFDYTAAFAEGIKLLESFATPSPAPTTFTYDSTAGAPPRVEAIKQSDNSLTTLHWDSTANLKVDSLEDPLTHRTTYTYDAVGMTTSVANPLNEIVTYQYDSQSRVEAVVDPLLKRTTFTYNSYSQVETIQNPLLKVWTITSDKVNRVTEQVNPLNNRTTYTYGANCLVQSVKNPLGKVTTYLYTTRDQLQQVTNPLGNHTTYTYFCIKQAGNRMVGPFFDNFFCAA
jgi:YD repeat-containing protein